MDHGVREAGGLEARPGLSETAQTELIQIQGPRSAPRVDVLDEHIVEFVSDAGEGAQTAGQIFGTVSARMGNGVWTVEIIPAEIEPPRRSRWAASGNRIRIATGHVTNMGEAADVVVAFNEQVLYNRIGEGGVGAGCVVFLEEFWKHSEDEAIRRQYSEAIADFADRQLRIVEVPMQQQCLALTPDPRRGKNVWALGMLLAVYERDLGLAEEELERRLGKKGHKVVELNKALLRSGHGWAQDNVDFRYRISAGTSEEAKVVMNGNEALALGIMAAGIEVCSMYPITPATSVSHFLASRFEQLGGVVHQAEDEISAIGFALGASYAGKTAVTITSGPGLALKTEFIGLGVMAEIPLVIIDVQRGGPSTGLPTRVEQGDLLAAVMGQPGDTPTLVLAPSSIEECFHFVITARKLAETFRVPVLLLTDASLATGQQPFTRPQVQEEWLSPPIDQLDWEEGAPPYDWDEGTGLSRRPIPGQKHGAYVLTGLAHDEESHVAYDSTVNQRGLMMRRRKLATLRKSLKRPTVHGSPAGELLVVGWGSTRGAIEEAVDHLRSEGKQVSSLTLRFLSPMEPGLKEIFSRFRRVMTVEMNYSERLDEDEEGRTYSQLALLLRAQTLVDVDCWSVVDGVPLSPQDTEDAIRRRLSRPAVTA